MKSTVAIQTFDLEHTSESLNNAGISYTVECYAYCWMMHLTGSRVQLENWMKYEYTVGMAPEVADEFIADIEDIEDNEEE